MCEICDTLTEFTHHTAALVRIQEERHALQGLILGREAPVDMMEAEIVAQRTGLDIRAIAGELDIPLPLLVEVMGA